MKERKCLKRTRELEMKCNEETFSVIPSLCWNVWVTSHRSAVLAQISANFLGLGILGHQSGCTPIKRLMGSPNRVIL